MGLKVGVLGATGYTGAELIRYLVNHSGVEISWLTSEKFAGKKISEVFPQFRKFLDIECVNIAKLAGLDEVDVAFSCLPHGTSMHFVSKLLQKGTRVIDFSSDFRIKDVETYERWYKVKHAYRYYIEEAVYGLPEIYREKIRDARLVANPGCFATSVILGLAPLYSRGLIKEDSVIVDSKAGITGAGRAPSLEQHYSECNESVSSYRVEGHRQKPEMEHVLSNLGEGKANVTFVPHTVPISRGILTTIYTRYKEKGAEDGLIDLYNQFYIRDSFVRVYKKDKLPSVKSVRFSNFCDIGLGFQEGSLIAVVALDNLGKGASGQAVQNMNIMFDFPEEEALKSPGIFP
ncbi:MAG: N-acetyl-gamma-glutamyl-phosphate reductase [Candidatus Dadabacteria bacterium]|nr:N-acetyl-gamma-glutamyl-phosphate reductase [Candidatus Dadabacteria bacterium]